MQHLSRDDSNNTIVCARIKPFDWNQILEANFHKNIQSSNTIKFPEFSLKQNMILCRHLRNNQHNQSQSNSLLERSWRWSSLVLSLRQRYYIGHPPTSQSHFPSFLVDIKYELVQHSLIQLIERSHIKSTEMNCTVTMMLFIKVRERFEDKINILH